MLLAGKRAAAQTGSVTTSVILWFVGRYVVPLGSDPIFFALDASRCSQVFMGNKTVYFSAKQLDFPSYAFS